jgi:hypothetical protein
MSAAAVIAPNAALDHEGSSHDPLLRTDERLVKRATTGHRAAFDELYKLHRE